MSSLGSSEAAEGPAPASTQQPPVQQERRRYHAVTLELAGAMEDPAAEALSKLLHQCRLRYGPTVRVLTSLVAASGVDEARVFGDHSPATSAAAASAGNGTSHSGAEGTRAPQTAPAIFSSPKWAVTANKSIPVVPRLHRRLQPPNSSACGGTPSTGDSAAAAAAVASGTAQSPSSPEPLALAAGDSAGDTRTSAQMFEDFMRYRFLPLAMTHNFTRPSNNVIGAAPVSASAAAAAVSSKQQQEQHGVRAAETTAPDYAFFTPPQMEHMSRHLVARHYVHEASRTASLMVADTAAGAAVIIDPLLIHTEAYAEDLARLGVRLQAMVATHCWVDTSLAVAELQERYGPHVPVLSGVRDAPTAAGTELHTIVVGGDIYSGDTDGDSSASTTNHAAAAAAAAHLLSLRLVAAPSFSPECVFAEVYVYGVLAAVATGPAWGTDTPPRADLFDTFPLPADPRPPPSSRYYGLAASAVGGFGYGPAHGGGVREAQRTLRALFHGRYHALRGAPAGTGTGGGDGAAASPTGNDAPDAIVSMASSSSPSALADTAAGEGLVVADAPALPPGPRAGGQWPEAALLLPSHGGYSHVTPQLDMYWALYVGQCARQPHTLEVLLSFSSLKRYEKFYDLIPPLPQPPMFPVLRRHNYRLLRGGTDAAATGGGASSPPSISPSPSKVGSFPPVTAALSASGAPRPPLLVDVRDFDAYYELHMRGAVCVPMSYPGAAVGAKRAELWLQCLLLPGLPVVALCDTPAQRPEVSRRLAALAPGAPWIAVHTLEEVLPGAAGILEGLRAQSEARIAAKQQRAAAASAAAAAGGGCRCCCGNQVSAGGGGGEAQCHSCVRAGGAGAAADSTAAAETDRDTSAAPSVPHAPPYLVVSSVFRAEVPAGGAAARVARSLPSVAWVHTPDRYLRLSDAASMRDSGGADPVPGRVVLDVRTPYEFKNGSHHHSVFLPLSRLCELTVSDWQRLLAATEAPPPLSLLSEASVRDFMNDGYCPTRRPLWDRFLQEMRSAAALTTVGEEEEGGEGEGGGQTGAPENPQQQQQQQQQRQQGKRHGKRQKRETPDGNTIDTNSASPSGNNDTQQRQPQQQQQSPPIGSNSGDKNANSSSSGSNKKPPSAAALVPPGTPTEMLLYCAGGYRSLVASSLLLRAYEVAPPVGCCRRHASPPDTPGRNASVDATHDSNNNSSRNNKGGGSGETANDTTTATAGGGAHDTSNDASLLSAPLTNGTAGKEDIKTISTNANMNNDDESEINCGDCSDCGHCDINSNTNNNNNNTNSHNNTGNGNSNSKTASSSSSRCYRASVPVLNSPCGGRASFPSVVPPVECSLCRRVRLADIPGGALQIMTMRPDLWRVKDRSIICIS